MRTELETAGAMARLNVSGKIDKAGAETMKQAFCQISLTGLSQFAFDFSGVTHIGSSGLGKLRLFYKRLSAAKISRAIEGSPEGSPAPIATLMRELRLDTLFEIK
jgi:anti-anti-sigma regulatory factor